MPIPRDVVVKILLDYGWTNFHAVTYAQKIPANYDVALIEKSGAAGMYISTCPGFIITGIAPVEWGSNVEHEFHHAWDFRECKRHLQTVRIDISKLTDLPEARAALIQCPPSDNEHLNHVLAWNLQYNYDRIPEWYREKYFGYTLSKQVYLPLAQRRY